VPDFNEQKKLRLVIKGFLRGDSIQYRIIKTKITQYIFHQNYGAVTDKDEIISNVLEILFENFRGNKFRGDSLSALNVYIYSIIRHRISREIRRKSRLELDDDVIARQVDTRLTEADNLPHKDLAVKIYRALDYKCRELLALKFQECWTDQEIADHLNRTKNATSTAISRCVKKAQSLDIVKEFL
jgi:RNA polymerase sigma factor (sigma-70 family)